MSDRQIVISEPNARVLRSLLRARNGQSPVTDGIAEKATPGAASVH